MGEQLRFVFIAQEEPWHERLALEVRRRAKLRDDEIALAPTIAERVMGCEVAIASELAATACLTRTDGAYQILIREVHSDTNFDIAHELAHYALREIEKYRGPDEERYANQIAANIIAPRPIVRAVCRRHGRGVEAIRPLARATRLSQTAAHFRLGEVWHDGRLVVTAMSGNVLIRTTGQIDWTTLPVAELARGRQERRDVEREELSGGIDAGRIALRTK